MIIYTNTTSKKTRKQKAKQQKLWEEQQSRVGHIKIQQNQNLTQQRGMMIRSDANDFKSIKSAKVDAYDTFKREDKVYTGNNVIGIAVQHKSCLQPIFSEESAKDSASMRR